MESRGANWTMMMNMERRNGEMKPVIRKTLVELDAGKPFQKFAEKRDEWAKETCFVYPDQYNISLTFVCDRTTRTLALEQE